MRFMVVMHDLGMNRAPAKIELPKTVRKATRLDGNQFELNLYDPVDSDSLNSLERDVASFLDEQSQLYFWYRNIPTTGITCRAGRSHEFMPISFSQHKSRRTAKGLPQGVRPGNEGIASQERKHRLQEVGVSLCNEHAKRRTWNELVPAMLREGDHLRDCFPGRMAEKAHRTASRLDPRIVELCLLHG